MSERLPFNFTTALVVALSAVPASAWAAGPWLSETGGADMGMAGAGRAALSLDAASLASNPAALAGLPGSTISAAAMPLKLDFDFRGTAATPASATNEAGISTLPALYAVHRGDRFTYGIGAYSYLGLAFDLGNEWEGRRIIERAGLATFNVAPAVAWQASERFVIGASIAAQVAEPEARAAVSNEAMYYGPPLGLADGQLELSGRSWATAGQLGLTYEPNETLRYGLAWTAPVDHSVALDVSPTNLHPVLATLVPPDGAAKLDFTTPQQLLLGITHQSDTGTTLALGLSWQDWSSFGESKLRLSGQSSPVFAAGLQDTWGASMGVRRSLNANWVGSTGVSYESSPAPRGGVPAYFPAAEQWKLAAGAERAISDTWRVRGEFSMIIQGDADVVQLTHPLPLPGIPQISGTYEDTRVYMIALAVDFMP